MSPLRWKNYLWDEPHPAHLEEIESLERRWGVKLPEEYKRTVALHQGMTPVPSAFKVGRAIAVVNNLLTLGPDPKWGGTYSAASVHEQFKEFLPTSVYPFAMTPSGEYLCFDYRASLEEPTVVLMSVDAELHPVAGSFREFLKALHEPEG